MKEILCAFITFVSFTANAMTHDELEIIEKVAYIDACTYVMKKLDMPEERGFLAWMSEKYMVQHVANIQASKEDIEGAYQKALSGLTFNEDLALNCANYINYMSGVFDIYKNMPEKAD